jgi:hypothetical protein
LQLLFALPTLAAISNDTCLRSSLPEQDHDGTLDLMLKVIATLFSIQTQLLQPADFDFIPLFIFIRLTNRNNPPNLANTIACHLQTLLQLSAECEASDSELQLAINDAEQLLHNVRAKIFPPKTPLSLQLLPAQIFAPYSCRFHSADCFLCWQVRDIMKLLGQARECLAPDGAAADTVVTVNGD